MRLAHTILYLAMLISRVIGFVRTPARIRALSTTVGAWKIDELPAVVVRNDKAKYFQNGYPLVYVDAIAKLVGHPQAGEDVLVKDNSGTAIGRGFYNPHSMFRVRMVAMKDDSQFGYELKDLIVQRIQQAMALRRSLLLPRQGTNVYRLVNCEGDHLSGVIIDVLGFNVVIQSSAVWVELHREHIEAAVKCIPELADKNILWRRSEDRLYKDGIDEVNKLSADALLPEHHADTGTEEVTEGNTHNTSESIDSSSALNVCAADSESVANEVVVENDLKFSIDATGGQKTGFYCDQRDNRLYLRSISAGKSVLDLYCYSGGFSLNALQGGASSVMAVDSSLKAMESVKENMILNGFDVSHSMKPSGFADTSEAPEFGDSASSASVHSVNGDVSHKNGKSGQIELVKGEAERVMKTLAEQGRQFDIVICDPPKLAPTKTSLHRAARKYEKVNSMAMQLVSAQGGLLLTCTCSAAMTQSGQFLGMLQDAAAQAGRKITVLRMANAAPDHTVAVSYQEGQYFTSVLLYVQ